MGRVLNVRMFGRVSNVSMLDNACLQDVIHVCIALRSQERRDKHIESIVVENPSDSVSPIQKKIDVDHDALIIYARLKNHLCQHLLHPPRLFHTVNCNRTSTTSILCPRSVEEWQWLSARCLHLLK